MAEQVHITEAGYKALEKKLEFLKTTRRAEITADIATARGFGDLSENAEYDAAKNEQAKNELEITELELMLKNAVLIKESDNDGKTVALGSVVRIKFLDLDKEDEFKLVGSAEADIDANPKRISNDSPIGKALLGTSKGDTLSVNAPGGTVKIKVIAVNI